MIIHYALRITHCALHMEKMSLSIIMPALNEENDIRAAVENTLQAFDDFQVEGEIIVVNDGSTDRTPDIVCDIMAQDDRVSMIEHESPQGIGAAFWDGVGRAKGSIVSMFPGDNENDPWEALRYYKLLEHVDIVVPFAFNKEVRPLYRNLLSYIYRQIINATFLVNFNYTNGTILYRKSILEKLPHQSMGFFFQTDILIRAVKRGYLYAEVPYRLGLRSHGVSKAVTFPSLIQVIKGYFRLVRDIYSTEGRKIRHSFVENSLTAERYNHILEISHK
jgi:glycosyltransferase involved in cell wall biosynthesis